MAPQYMQEPAIISQAMAGVLLLDIPVMIASKIASKVRPLER